MVARINKEQKEKVKKRIIDAAYELFSKKGYEETKTKEISKKARIAEGTLFNYFSTKAGIYLEAMFSKIDLEREKLITKEMSRETINEIIMEYLTKTFKIFLRLPKPVLREVMHITTYFSKKKRKLFDQFSDVDYKAISELEQILKEMVEKGFL